MTLSLLAIGNTGAGKSTIGNIIVTDGEPEGKFETSDDPDSCTSFAETKTGMCGGIKVSFTDTPGIPDTNPARTKECYNKVIEAIKSQPHSAILFVFEYGRINPDLYQKAEILFREIQMAICLKVLIINDHQFREEPITKEQNMTLAKSITEYTKMGFLIFDDVCFVNRTTMADKMRKLVSILKEVEPVSSIHLRTFTELEFYVNEAKTDAEYLEMVKQQAQFNLDQKKRMEALFTGATYATGGVAACSAAVLFSVCVPVLITNIIAAGFIGAAATAGAITVEIGHLAGGLYAIKASFNWVLESLSLRRKERLEAEQHNEHIEKVWVDAVEELKNAEKFFKKLCNALNATESSS